jgi:hypothetical protein
MLLNCLPVLCPSPIALDRTKHPAPGWRSSSSMQVWVTYGIYRADLRRGDAQGIHLSQSNHQRYCSDRQAHPRALRMTGS